MTTNKDTIEEIALKVTEVIVKDGVMWSELKAILETALQAKEKQVREEIKSKLPKEKPPDLCCDDEWNNCLKSINEIL
jgi:hypothetical protein